MLEVVREGELAERVGWARTVDVVRDGLDPGRVASVRALFARKELGWTQLRNHELAREIEPDLGSVALADDRGHADDRAGVGNWTRTPAPPSRSAA